jgi:hypothetical protein
LRGSTSRGSTLSRGVPSPPTGLRPPRYARRCAYAVDPKHRYQTAIGNVGFDRNGDSTQRFLTFHRIDATAANRPGDWVAYKQQDFGPPR